MSLVVRNTPKFEKLFKKLPRDVQKRIAEKITGLSDIPYQGKPLHGKLKGKFSLIIGDYRIIYEVRENMVYLLAVGHRKKVYERLEKS